MGKWEVPFGDVVLPKAMSEWLAETFAVLNNSDKPEFKRNWQGLIVVRQSQGLLNHLPLT